MHQLLFMMFSMQHNMWQVVWLQSIRTYFLLISSTNTGTNKLYPRPYGILLTLVFLSQVHMNINVWDTNTTQVVMNFKMPGKVYKTANLPCLRHTCSLLLVQKMSKLEME